MDEGAKKADDFGKDFGKGIHYSKDDFKRHSYTHKMGVLAREGGRKDGHWVIIK